MAPPHLGRHLGLAFFIASRLIGRSPGSSGTGSFVMYGVGVLATSMGRGLPGLVVGVAVGVVMGVLAFSSQRREPL